MWPANAQWGCKVSGGELCSGSEGEVIYPTAYRCLPSTHGHCSVGTAVYIVQIGKKHHSSGTAGSPSSHSPGTEKGVGVVGHYDPRSQHLKKSISLLWKESRKKANGRLSHQVALRWSAHPHVHTLLSLLLLHHIPYHLPPCLCTSSSSPNVVYTAGMMTGTSSWAVSPLPRMRHP